MTKTLVAAAAVAWLGTAAAVTAQTKTMTGKISDSLCGASHKEMAAKQGSTISDRDCVIACLNYSTENSPKLVFVEKGGKIYQVANQKFPGMIRRAGDTIALTGDINGTTITVTKIEAAK
jgi:hypothetical protein